MTLFKNNIAIKRKLTPSTISYEEKLSMARKQIQNVLLGFNDHHYVIKNAANKLIFELLNSKISVGKSNKSGVIFGYKSLTQVFAKTFDDAILEIFPIGSFIHSTLFKDSNVNFPISQYLSNKDSYIDLRSALHSASYEYHLTCMQHDEHKLFRNNCESLEVLMEVLNVLAAIAPKDKKERWCSICFRIHPCSTHRTNEGDQNYEYDLGRSIRKKLEKGTLSRWKSYRNNRHALGEEFTFFSKLNYTDIIHEHESIILIDEYIHELFIITETENWAFASEYWKSFINENFKNLNFLPEPSKSTDYNHYHNNVLMILNNRSEKSKNPLWFLYLLEEANDWYLAEQKNKLKTIDKILELQKKMLNLSEIATMLGITRSAVSKSLKEHESKKTF